MLNLDDVRLGAFDERQHCCAFLYGNLESVQSRVQVAEKRLPIGFAKPCGRSPGSAGEAAIV